MSAGTATHADLDTLDRELASRGSMIACSVSHRFVVTPFLRCFIIVSAAIAIVVAAVRAWSYWLSGAWVDVPAGVMIAMAVDLRHGLFYRPLLGLAGYGGTRYFPLYFVLHALLLKLGFSLLLSAYLLSTVAIVLLIVGTFYLLRELGAERWLAACAAASLLTSVSTLYALVSPHADGLACALNIWALVVIARPNPNRRKILLAAILFTLAWSAKMTTIFGLVAVVVWLVNTGFRRKAWQLSGETCCGYLLIAGGVIVGSGGRFLEIFRACASGGTTYTYLAYAPWSLIASARRNDPTIFLFLAFGLLILAIDFCTPGANLLQNLPALFFIATLAVTVTIFGSPGTNFNHFLDLQVAAVILITVWLTKRASLQQKQLGVFALALVTLIAVQPMYHRVGATTQPVTPHRFLRVGAAIGNISKPILSENPIIPLLAGQSPYVMDSWMLRMIGRRNLDFERPLLEGLHNQSFGAVVLCMADPRTNYGRVWYETESFGSGFVPALNRNYRLASVVDDQMIYLPIQFGAINAYSDK